jgi:hypothetical protein
LQGNFSAVIYYKQDDTVSARESQESLALARPRKRRATYFKVQIHLDPLAMSWRRKHFQAGIHVPATALLLPILLLSIYA